MSIVGYILLALLAVLLLTLCCPVYIELWYSDSDLTVKLKLLYCLRLGLYPQKPPKADKPKAAKEKKEKKPAKEKKEIPKKEKKPMGLMDILELINDMLPRVGAGMGFIIRHIIIRRCRVTLTIEGEDAADTAIKYGQINAVCYNIYAYAASALKLKDFCLELIPCFSPQPQQQKACLEIGASPAMMLWGALRMGAAALGALLKSRSRMAAQQKQSTTN